MKLLPLIVALLVVTLGYASTYVVADGQTGTVTQMGQLVRVEPNPGLHFKWPLLQQAGVVDLRLQSTDSSGLRQLTADKQAVDLDVAVQWQVADSKRYAGNAGSSQAVAAQIRRLADQQLHATVQAYSLGALVALPSAQLAQPLQNALNSELGSHLGVKVLGVEVKQISVPDESLDGLYKDMQASQTKLAAQIHAQGQVDADKIQADADQQARQRVADARTQAARIRGEGEAKALQITAAASAQEPDFFAFYQNLQAYRAAFGQGGNVWILRPDSAFLRGVDGNGGTSANTASRVSSH